MSLLLLFHPRSGGVIFVTGAFDAPTPDGRSGFGIPAAQLLQGTAGGGNGLGDPDANMFDAPSPEMTNA